MGEIERIKDISLEYLTTFFDYFKNKTFKKQKIIIYSVIFIIFISWIVLNYINYTYYQANKKYNLYIKTLNKRITFFNNNNNKLLLLKKLNNNQEINWNTNLLNFLYTIYNKTINFDNWNTKIKITWIQKIQWKNEIIIIFNNIVKYAFFDYILKTMKLYNLNVDIKNLNIKVNNNNQNYLSYQAKITLDYNNIFNK